MLAIILGAVVSGCLCSLALFFGFIYLLYQAVGRLGSDLFEAILAVSEATRSTQAPPLESSEQIIQTMKSWQHSTQTKLIIKKLERQDEFLTRVRYQKRHHIFWLLVLGSIGALLGAVVWIVSYQQLAILS